ncbi:MAG: hypothetical protein ACTSQJ_02950 [Promethearchaeota archaeon]
MFSENNFKKRTIALILIGLFLIPANLMFLKINSSENKDDSEVMSENNTDLDVIQKKPKASQLVEHTFEINGSKIYENGTFYLFQEDILFFSLRDPLLGNPGVITAQITVNHPVDGVINFPLTDTNNVEWNATRLFSNSVGRCPSVLSYTNGTDTVIFNFFLDISNPAPRITKIWGRDTAYNNRWTRINEGGIYSTYRNTRFELLVETINKEQWVSSCVLEYTDHIGTNTVGLTSVNISQPYRFFDLVGAGTGISITLDQTDRWIPDDNLYSFVLNASDSEDFYLFEFYIEIKNKAPQITEFELSPHNEPSPSKGGTTTVTINMNASDFEDDKIYFGGGNEKSAKYTDPVLDVDEKPGCTINSPSSKNLNYLREEDGIDYYNLTFSSGVEGQFFVWLYVNDEINLNKITSFELKVVMKDNAAALSFANLSIYDFNGGGWDVMEDLSGGEAVFTTITKTDADVPGSAVDYYSPDNKTVKIKFSYYYALGDIDVLIDYIQLTTTVNRRESFSRVTLYVFKPTSLTPEEYEIINYWDNGNKRWSFSYDIENKYSNYGSWTFQILVMDHGKKEYINQIWGNFTLAVSSSAKYHYGFDENLPNYGQAYASKIFSIGVRANQELNISSAPIVQNATDVDTKFVHNDQVNISIDVDGVNTQFKDYTIFDRRRLVAGLSIQKNTTSNTTSGSAIFPLYNKTGSPENLTVDDNKYFGFRLVSKAAQDWMYHTVIWSLKLENTWWLTKDNISKIVVRIDNWFNDTTNINNIWFEMWNYTAGAWTVPSSPGVWNDANLMSLGANQYFDGVINSATDLQDLVDSSSNIIMRLRIDVINPVALVDYEINFDFINVTVVFKNYYRAKLLLDSAMNPYASNDKLIIKLTPYAKGQWTMQYSCVVNISSLGFYADRFIMIFTIQNGNSSIWYHAFRKAPRIINSQFIGYYYYKPSEEKNYIDKGFTLNIYDPKITFSRDSSLNRFLYVKELHNLVVQGTLNLKQLEFVNPNIQTSFDVREGTNTLSGSWRRLSGIVYNPSLSQWSYTDPIDGDYKNYKVYYCRFYIRTPFGDDYATDWKEFRVNNFQMIDFEFSFDTGVRVELNRRDTYTFDFSFLDYDLNETYASKHVDDVQISFQIHNKTSGLLEWIDATPRSSFGSYGNGYGGKGGDNRHTYRFDLYIPKTVTTSKFNSSYFNWRFLVKDERSNPIEYQDQVSYLFYNATEFVIKNNEPSIINLDTDDYDNDDGRIHRNNPIKISFGINDADEDNDISLEVVYLNISVPAPSGPYTGSQNITMDNSSISIVSGLREYIYFAQRNSTIGTYTVSIKIVDPDGREAYDSITFEVLNNAPHINNTLYTCNNFTQVNTFKLYRNIDPVYNIDPVVFMVNITDVEDSWLGDNITNGNGADNPYILLKHKSEYNIEKKSPAIEPIRLNLTLVSPGTNANGHMETWTASIQFNNTMLGQKLYGGVLIVEIHIEDADGVKRTSTGKTLTGKDLILLNHDPQFIEAQIDELGMKEPNIYYFESSVQYEDDIDVYIFADDEEGLWYVKIWYTPFVGDNEIADKQISEEFYEWDEKYYDGVRTLKITLEASEFPEETVIIRIDKIGIFDDDYERMPDSGYGATLKIKEVDEEITIEEVPIEVKSPIMLYVFIGLGIALLAIVVVVGVRQVVKKRGWKKYLD